MPFIQFQEYYRKTVENIFNSDKKKTFKEQEQLNDQIDVTILRKLLKNLDFSNLKIHKNLLSNKSLEKIVSYLHGTEKEALNKAYEDYLKISNTFIE